MSNPQTPTLDPALAAKIAALPFTATLTHKAANPDDGPDKWVCSLQGEPFTYSKGVGLRLNPCQAYRPTFAQVQLWLRKSQPIAPTALELLECLTRDASLYDDSRDVDDFAANYCEGQGIQQTLDSYNECARAGRLLRRWFSPGELSALQERAANQ